MSIGKVTAYKAVQLLNSDGLSITQKTLSMWKRLEKVKVDEDGKVNFEEVRAFLIESKKHPEKTRVRKKTVKKTDDDKKKQTTKKKNKTESKDDKTLFDKSDKNKDLEKEEIKELHKRKLSGDAWKSYYASQKAEIDLKVARGELIDKSVIEDYVNATFSAHNKRLVNVPEKIVDICIAIVRSKEDDSDARVTLIKKWNKELSNILESEKKEVKRYLRRKVK
jgi:hypothetical protein